MSCAVFPIAAETIANRAEVVPEVVAASIIFVTRITSDTPSDCVPVTGVTARCPEVNRSFFCAAVPAELSTIAGVLILPCAEIATAFTLAFVFGVFPVWSQVAYTLPLKDPAEKVKLSRFGVIVTDEADTTVTSQSIISPATIWGSSVPALVAARIELFDATKI